MPCMCGDPYCSSCGPAQGNNRCYICGKWEFDGGCDNPEDCQATGVLIQRQEDCQEYLTDYDFSPYYYDQPATQWVHEGDTWSRNIVLRSKPMGEVSTTQNAVFTVFFAETPPVISVNYQQEDCQESIEVLLTDEDMQLILECLNTVPKENRDQAWKDLRLNIMGAQMEMGFRDRGE